MDWITSAALLLPWALIAFQCWLILLLLRQHGRSLLSQDELGARLGQVETRVSELAERLARGEGTDAHAGHDHGVPAAPLGLPIGSAAPDWRLNDLAGRERKLQDFLGKPLLVVFFSPQCGYCLQMAPRLAELPADGPSVLLISEGDPEEHRRLALEHRWRCDVVLQKDWAVSNAYEASGTPTGYLLDAEGRIASDLAIGGDALLRLATRGNGNGGAQEHDPAAATERARSAGLAVRPSKLQRDGLPPGTLAPSFSLPDLDGKPRALSDFRGRRVLLVFSDPGCEPCQALASELARRDRESRGNHQIVMISRGAVAANREKAREHGLAFPILLQKQWEISKEYAMFATPVAYLIDEQGLTVSEVAVGADAIRTLI